MVDPFLLNRRPVRPVAKRSDLARALRSALDGGAGFAAAKLGRSEQAMLLYPTLLERCRLERQRIRSGRERAPPLRGADGDFSL